MFSTIVFKKGKLGYFLFLLGITLVIRVSGKCPDGLRFPGIAPAKSICV